MTDGKVISVTWDGPLDIEFDWRIDDLREEIQRVTPGRTGALMSAFDDPSTVTINQANDEITVYVGPQHDAYRYAAIQNWGGPSHDIIIKPKHALALRFFWMGRVWFRKQVTMHAHQIKGHWFVERGFKVWIDKLLNSRVVRFVSGAQGTVTGEWGSKHYSEPVSHEGTPSA